MPGMIKREKNLMGFWGYGADPQQFRQVAEALQRRQREQFVKAVDAVARATDQEIDGNSLAAQICRAAAKARGEIPLPPLSEPAPGSTAAKILEMGRVRRGEVVAPQFPDTEAGRRAKMIVNMGRRRRGEEEIK
jgi:hypothetical protein